MKKNLKDYLYKIDGFLDPKLCDQTIKEISSLKFKQHKFYDHRTGAYTPISGSQELSVSEGVIPSKKIIMDKLWYAIRGYIRELNFKWFYQWKAYTPIRFNKYSKNKKMAPHCDHIHSIFDGVRQGVPILSVLGTLNENYKGGEFIMFDNHEIKFKKGDLLIFPSSFLYPHKVEPVKKGTRYSYISWVF
jgi:hypothetical protein